MQSTSDVTYAICVLCNSLAILLFKLKSVFPHSPKSVLHLLAVLNLLHELFTWNNTQYYCNT